MLQSESTTAGPTAPVNRSTLKLLGRLAGTVALLLLLLALGRRAGSAIPGFVAWVDGLGVWGPVVFILGYALATVAFIPGSLLTLAGGAIFGIFEGTIYVFAGATLGATAAFLLARYVARRAVERRLESSRRFAAIDSAVAKEGRRIVVLLRLSPIFPFILLNYGLGLTKVKLWDYVVASLGMIPGTLLYVYYGKLAGDVAALAAGAGPEKDWKYYTVLIVGLVATVVVTTYVTRLAGRALRSVRAVEDEVPIEGSDSDTPDLENRKSQE